jgi:hypothetical protein
MTNHQDDTSLKTAIGTSTLKNSYEAGKEVGEKILKKLNCQPSLVLLFSTLHYNKYDGGLKDLLKGIWSVLPDDTQLAGGTVPGFLNNDGCYAQGVTAFAISYPNMNVTIAYGKNTKRSPKKAARHAVKMIKTNLKNEYKNKFIFSFIAGAKSAKVPGVKNTNIINSKIKAKIMLSMILLMQRVFQIGFGKEEEVLENIIKELPDFNIIHYSSYSMPPFNENYQFYNKEVVDEYAVFVAVDTDLDCYMDFATAAEKTNIEFKITKINKKRTVVEKLNNKAPLNEYINKMGWTYEEFQDFKWSYITSKYPIGYIKNDKIILRPPLLILGNYMGFLTKIEKNDIFITKVTPDQMVCAVDEILKPKKPDFGFFTSCIARRDFLGIKVFKVQEKMKNYFENKDFLIVYGAGEGIHKPEEGFYFLNETITCAIFKKNP